MDKIAYNNAIMNNWAAIMAWIDTEIVPYIDDTKISYVSAIVEQGKWGYEIIRYKNTPVREYQATISFKFVAMFDKSYKYTGSAFLTYNDRIIDINDKSHIRYIEEIERNWPEIKAILLSEVVDKYNEIMNFNV